ncbi:RHS repeat-associated core domain-containing protein [Pseudomonas kurunegalensis]|uniref:RHS repeat-associated core domain-containing protein n=1 Tax=Pseudomonas kurunegalensis TaxID=485880 RepID=UPI0032EB2461
MTSTHRYFYNNDHLVNVLRPGNNQHCFQWRQLPLAEHSYTSDARTTQLLQTDSSDSVSSVHLPHAVRNINYTVYGYAKQHVNSPQIKGFNGYSLDAFTNLYHLGQGRRSLSTALLRFTSPDRLSPFSKGGINSYCYCHGDPVNFRDPNGTSRIRNLLKYFGTKEHRKK